ncbi:hypothetical protein HQ533_01505 [Candidatus Woesearchaeota archaeon]|nr:hypothetical protein [Candidatus Woesearchaeota archaeon]
MEEITLKEWTIHFVKNKDLLQKNLVDYEEKENPIVFHFKDKDCQYLILEVLDDSVFSFIRQTGLKTVVCLGKKENLNFFIENWKTFSSIQDLNFVFARIHDSRRWIINPFVHNKICDDESLVLGLKSMFSSTFQP